jgi:hypothetical protein
LPDYLAGRAIHNANDRAPGVTVERKAKLVFVAEKVSRVDRLDGLDERALVGAGRLRSYGFSWGADQRR